MISLCAINETSPLLITCGRGIAPFTVRELAALGFAATEETATAIKTRGTMDDAMRLNLWLRTAQHVHKLLARFTARDAQEMHEQVGRLPWEEWIPEDGYVCVTSAVSTPSIRDPRFANVKCKDAVVDRLRYATGRRPNSGPRQDHTVLFLRWNGCSCELYLDTSGEPLHRRGYRRFPLRAPMQETLAAAVIMATDWTPPEHFVNPMCGSGTLAIEAALMAAERAPGLGRASFGFMHVKTFDSSAWRRIRERAESAPPARGAARIIASDRDDRAVEAARRNASAAHIEHLVDWAVCDFAQTYLPTGGGVIVLNPEYGRRMGEEEALIAEYRRIGDFFKQHGQGFRGYVFTGNLDLGKRVGLRSSRRLLFFNGPIECRLLRFDLYEGTRRARYAGASTGQAGASRQ